MKLTASDIFHVITGFPMPQNALPDTMQKEALGLAKTLELLCGEKIYCFQLERVRQECKIWLFKRHSFLLEWNLSHDVLIIPGAIITFFESYPIKHYYLEIDPLPPDFHVSVDPFKEKAMQEVNNKLRDAIWDIKNV